ncbi:hypothetical protein C8F01DRAFT_1238233 [Mycena amicta]|nr:hypothetical protein C8F01DRAFT_1238233 [Mycena amicta]
MPRFHDFSAWISIDGAAVPEYDVQTSVEDNLAIVSCWIPSEVGKKFSVKWRNEAHPQDTGGFVKMDGTRCGGRFILRKVLPHTTEMDGVRTVEGTAGMQPFVFARLTLSDDDVLLDSSAPHEDLGLIELRITPVRNFFKSEIETPSLAPLQVHERMKKAVTQQITLGDPLALEKPLPTYKAARSGPDIVKFVFKYRPDDVLRANGITPPMNAENSPRKRKRKAKATSFANAAGSNLLEDVSSSSSDSEDQTAQELKLLRDRVDAALAVHRASRSQQDKEKKRRKSNDTTTRTEDGPSPRKRARTATMLKKEEEEEEEDVKAKHKRAEERGGGGGVEVETQNSKCHGRRAFAEQARADSEAEEGGGGRQGQTQNGGRTFAE